MTILDDLEEEAKEIVRREENLAQLIGQHRRSVMNALQQNKEKSVLVNILSKTDFKGYFRDRLEYH